MANIPQSLPVRRDALLSPSSIQELLDENVRLIHSLMAHQRCGAVKESSELQQVLHRNLICLATVADRTTGHIVPTQAAGPNQGPPMVPNQPNSAVPTPPVMPMSGSAPAPPHQQPNSLHVPSTIQGVAERGTPIYPPVPIAVVPSNQPEQNLNKPPQPTTAVNMDGMPMQAYPSVQYMTHPPYTMQSKENGVPQRSQLPPTNPQSN